MGEDGVIWGDQDIDGKIRIFHDQEEQVTINLKLAMSLLLLLLLLLLSSSSSNDVRVKFMNVTVPPGRSCVNNGYLAVCLSALTNVCKLSTKLCISVSLRVLSVSVHCNTIITPQYPYAPSSCYIRRR
jgi:hypothetical protein